MKGVALCLTRNIQQLLKFRNRD